MANENPFRLSDEEKLELKKEIESFSFDDCTGSVSVGPITVNVEHDDIMGNPLREFDYTIGLLITDKHYAHLGNFQDTPFRYPEEVIDDTPGIEDWDEEDLRAHALKAFIAEYDIAVAMPITICDYGSNGISISVKYDPDNETTSKYGYAVATKKQVAEWYRKNFFRPELCKEFSRAVTSIVEELDNWANGRVYEFYLTDEDGAVVGEPCGGYIGYDHDKSGLDDEVKSALSSELGIEIEWPKIPQCEVPVSLLQQVKQSVAAGASHPVFL